MRWRSIGGLASLASALAVAAPSASAISPPVPESGRIHVVETCAGGAEVEVGVSWRKIADVPARFELTGLDIARDGSSLLTNENEAALLPKINARLNGGSELVREVSIHCWADGTGTGVVLTLRGHYIAPETGRIVLTLPNSGELGFRMD